jgi:hypothetical protein
MNSIVNAELTSLPGASAADQVDLRGRQVIAVITLRPPSNGHVNPVRAACRNAPNVAPEGQQLGPRGRLPGCVGDDELVMAFHGATPVPPRSTLWRVLYVRPQTGASNRGRNTP